jgi:dissimilatory sulfite reductase (desulfoviridin) alpha/beta subunit
VNLLRIIVTSVNEAKCTTALVETNETLCKVVYRLEMDQEVPRKIVAGDSISTDMCSTVRGAATRGPLIHSGR